MYIYIYIHLCIYKYICSIHIYVYIQNIYTLASVGVLVALLAS